jgi:hypothetical protein
MRTPREWSGLVVLAAMSLPAAAMAQTAAGKAATPAKAAPAASALAAPGAATGTLTVGGKSIALTHALAINAGAYIYLLITDQVLPPDQVKSEFQLGVYRFQHRVAGLELMLDPAHKVTEMAYLWEAAKVPCPACLDITISGGVEGPLTGTLKSTPKAFDTAKLKAEGTFNAPFARPSAGKN